MMAYVMILTNRTMTELFSVKINVKQSWVNPPELFSIFPIVMLHLTSQKLPVGMELIFRANGKLFSQWKLQSRSNVHSNVSRQAAVYR